MAVDWSNLSAQNVVKMNYSLNNFFHNKFITTTETITTTMTAAATTGYAVRLFLYRSIAVNVAGI